MDEFGWTLGALLIGLVLDGLALALLAIIAYNTEKVEKITGETKVSAIDFFRHPHVDVMPETYRIRIAKIISLKLIQNNEYCNIKNRNNSKQY